MPRGVCHFGHLSLSFGSQLCPVPSLCQKTPFLKLRLGKEITKLRKAKDISQDDLAVDCNMDRSYLAEFEEGKANPSLKVLCKIAYGLKIQISQLFVNV